MALRKREIKEIVRSYLFNGFANIFIVGPIGSGKTILSIQILDEICKELKIKPNIDMVYYNFIDFKESKDKVRLFEVDILSYNFKPYNLNDVLNDKINIFQLCNDRILDTLDTPYFKFETLFDGKTKIIRGMYKFNNVKGKFKDDCIFDIKDIYDKKKDVLINNSYKDKWDSVEYKDFTQRIRRERQINMMVLPKMINPELHMLIVKDRLNFISGGNEGSGKSSLALQLHNDIEKKYNRLKLKEDLEFLGLYYIYCIVSGILMALIGMFSMFLGGIVFGVVVLVGYEVFIKELFKRF